MVFWLFKPCTQHYVRVKQTTVINIHRLHHYLNHVYLSAMSDQQGYYPSYIWGHIEMPCHKKLFRYSIPAFICYSDLLGNSSHLKFHHYIPKWSGAYYIKVFATFFYQHFQKLFYTSLWNFTRTILWWITCAIAYWYFDCEHGWENMYFSEGHFDITRHCS